MLAIPHFGQDERITNLRYHNFINVDRNRVNKNTTIRE